MQVAFCSPNKPQGLVLRIIVMLIFILILILILGVVYAVARIKQAVVQYRVKQLFRFDSYKHAHKTV